MMEKTSSRKNLFKSSMNLPEKKIKYQTVKTKGKLRDKEEIRTH